MGIEIELARAAAYEQLRNIFEQYNFNKGEFPSIYTRDWRLCYEILQNKKGQLYDVVGVLQKQAANLLNVLLDAESTLEVYGSASELYKTILLDADRELNTLKALVKEREPVISEHGPVRAVEPIIEFKDGARVRQVEIILTAIKELGYDPKNVPNGGKAKIRKICEYKDLALFSKSSFDHAWKSEIGRASFGTINKERFKKR